jgi:hypothetical protein
MLQYIEKRSDRRINHSAPIIVEDINENYIYRAILINYSKHGLCFKSDVTLNKGTEICIGIESFNKNFNNLDGSPGYYQGTIRWGREISHNLVNHEYGVNINSVVATPIHHNEIPAKRKNLRKHRRRLYPKPVFFVSQNQYFQGFIHDISRNGALIESKDHFSIGQMIRLVIPGTKIDNGIMLSAKVVRLCDSGIGVKFKKLIQGKSI